MYVCINFFCDSLQPVRQSRFLLQVLNVNNSAILLIPKGYSPFLSRTKPAMCGRSGLIAFSIADPNTASNLSTWISSALPPIADTISDSASLSRWHPSASAFCTGVSTFCANLRNGLVGSAMTCSTNKNNPPGLSTRLISSRPPVTSGIEHSVSVVITASQLAVSTGMFSHVPLSSFKARLLSRALSLTYGHMNGLGSTPMTVEFGGIRDRFGPVPIPTSAITDPAEIREKSFSFRSLMFFS